MIMNKLKKAVVMVLALAMVLTCAMVTPVQAAGKLNKKSVSIYETETVSLIGNCETQICNMRAVIHNQWR